MGELKRRKENSTEEVKQEDVNSKEKEKEKKKPVKAGWNFRDNVGGIFTSKVAAIVRKLLGKE